MARVNILKQIKIKGTWILRSIPRKETGERDWKALPDGSYFIEWRENSERKRLPAGRTISQALEAQRIKKTELAAMEVGILQRYKPGTQGPERPAPLSKLIDTYLDQIDTLKKPNTYRKYKAVLTRFSDHFPSRNLPDIRTEEFNGFVVHLRKSGLGANTVLHNLIIVAQFCSLHGRRKLTKDLQLPEAVTFLPRVYSEEDIAAFLEACDTWELALFSTFLLTGFREQEVMYLTWPDINLKLRTVRVTAKPDWSFLPKRCEEREVPIPQYLVERISAHPQTEGSPFVFPSPTGNREQNYLLRCKAIATRAGVDADQFNLKTFRSTYATSMLRSGFDVRTVQHWMGHKSLETTMRYLAPAKDIHDRLDLIAIPGVKRHPRIGPKSEAKSVTKGARRRLPAS